MNIYNNITHQEIESINLLISLTEILGVHTDEDLKNLLKVCSKSETITFAEVKSSDIIKAINTIKRITK